MQAPPAASAPVLRLAVEGASPLDADRAIARLSRACMAALGLRPGDMIALRGTRLAHARALPQRDDAARPGTILMDAAQRENAGAGLGDAVAVSAARMPDAAEVDLTPEGPLPPHAGTLAEALAEAPAAEGDIVTARLAGVPVRLRVARLAPAGPARIVAGTRIRLLADTAPATGFAGIGGLAAQIARVREMVGLPLRRPDLFARLGIAPPRGVLFTGPPGCGKTLLARAVAREIDAAFFQIDGPEIVSKHYGDSEARLREVFAKAERAAPAIIFIDEIDAIAPRRDAISGEKQLERRIVSQLLTLLDGLEARGEVILMAATNLPHAIDPALRRPGRFDREIAFLPPDRAGRREILAVHLAAAPLAADVDLDRLAAETHGFVGADLAALAREAAVAALARAAAEAGSDAAIRAEDLRITGADIAAGRAAVGPSVLRGARIEVPETRWSDVGGLARAKQALIEAVIWPIRHAAAFRTLGIAAPGGVLLAGPPGCGKTLIARALATESGVNFVPVRCAQLLSQYLGEAERAVAETFARARHAAPCILFFDEIDAIAPVRGGADAALDRVVAELLVEIDGLVRAEGVFLLGATNRPGAIDPALLRPGRFAQVIALEPAGPDDRREILGIHARGIPLAAEVDLDAIADAAAGWSGAELEALCQTAARTALRRALVSAAQSPGLVVTAADFAAAHRERETSDTARRHPAGAASSPPAQPPAEASP